MGQGQRALDPARASEKAAQGRCRMYGLRSAIIGYAFSGRFGIPRFGALSCVVVQILNLRLIFDHL